MMNENEFLTRPYLERYDLALKIKEFFTEFVGDVSSYAYVSATERRCFNLAYIFLPENGRKNLTSNTGLLQYHRELSRYYIRNGCFPPILILDDIMVHGRGMSKFLYQLEALIEEDIQSGADNGQRSERQPDVRQMIRHRLAQAVDLVVFARNRRPLLLDDGYRYCLRSAYVISERELHDLSRQLSDSLTRWRKANTCFAYSEHNDLLWDSLVSEQTIQAIPVKHWQQIHWQYDCESMGVFLRFEGEQQTNQISTIRFFPGRRKQKWFTSFTMLGAMPEDLIWKLGAETASILQRENAEGCRHLIRLLTERRSDTASAIGQLLSYFLSVLDYRAFRRSILGFSYQMPDEAWLIAHTDIDKVCRNFGKAGDVLSGLAGILCSEERMEEISRLLKRETAASAEPICEMPSAGQMDGGDKISYDSYNEYVERRFYKVGIDAEENASRCFYNVAVFQPGSYQEYTGNRSLNDTGGVISLADFYEGAVPGIASDASDMNLYYLTAALIHVMDYGLMGIRIGGVKFSERQLFLCKTGEMSTFYGPKQVAAAIPALAELERTYRKSGFTPRERIEKFVRMLDENSVKALVEADGTQWDSDCHTLFQQLKDEILPVTREVYRGDQRYTEWDFENMTAMRNPAARKLQQVLQQLAASSL